MSTIPTIKSDHFRGESNLHSGQRSGDDATLSELLTAAKVDILATEADISTIESRFADSMVYWVDGTYTGVVSDGSFLRPYKTVQAAVDAVEALATTPTFSNPAVIALMPDRYPENVVISKDGLGVAIVGALGAGRQTTLINPASGAGLTVTNATPASLATYQGSGTYSDLAAKATPEAGPRRVILRNLHVSSADANAVDCLGVKGDKTADTTDFLSQGLLVYDALLTSTSDWSLFIKNGGSVSLREARFAGKTSILECGLNQLWDCNFEKAFAIEYDPADSDGRGALPSFVHKMIRCDVGAALATANATIGIGVTLQTIHCQFSGDLIVNDTGALTAHATFIDGDFDVNGASGAIVGKRLFVDGDMTVTVGKTGTLDALHIGGALTLDNGAGAWTFNGGEVMGAVTDVGGRLTFNLGTIGT